MLRCSLKSVHTRTPSTSYTQRFTQVSTHLHVLHSKVHSSQYTPTHLHVLHRFTQVSTHLHTFTSYTQRFTQVSTHLTPSRPTLRGSLKSVHTHTPSRPTLRGSRKSVHTYTPYTFIFYKHVYACNTSESDVIEALFNSGHSDSQSQKTKVGRVNSALANRRLLIRDRKCMEKCYLMINFDHYINRRLCNQRLKLI